jgi:hypothetical protein
LNCHRPQAPVEEMGIMLLKRMAVVAALVLTLTLAGSTAEAGGKKKKKQRPVKGVVTAVVTKENGERTVTVKVTPRKKAATPDSKEAEKTFTISKDAKVVKATDKKGKGETKDATFGDVAKGGRVIVATNKAGAVEKVTLLPKGKKKA